MKRGDGGLGKAWAAVAMAAMMVFVARAASAHPTVRRVPHTYATIQAAIDASQAGDTIEVGPGEYCGATVDRTVHLVGRGLPTIVGCADGPSLARGERIGFALPGADGVSPASGTSVEGFVFDGRGLSQTNLEPLAVGVIARSANDVRIQHNVFHGTIQAITNTAGDGWLIAGNDIFGLTLFDCTGALCEGGDGIVVQIARDPTIGGGPSDPISRPERNVVVDNRISGAIPDGFDTFSMTGIFVLAADGTLIARNQVTIPDNPTAGASGDGVLISNSCCGEAPLFPGTRNTAVLFNDGRHSQFGVVVEGTGGANTAGLALFGNSGTIMLEGTVVATGGHRLSRLDRGPRHVLY